MRPPMHAFLGLSSEPVQVENITVEGITLRDSRRRRHQKTVIELVNTAGDFGCLVPMQVVRVTTHPEGGYMVVGTFVRKLTDKELMTLCS